MRTAELEERLLRWTADGGTLRAFCRLAGSPHNDTVYDWLDKDSELQKRFDKARLRGGRLLAEEILEIANKPHAGEIRTEETIELLVKMKVGKGKKQAPKVAVPGTKITVRTEDMLGHRKLQIEARERVLKLWFPDWFTKKIEHSGSIGIGEALRKAHARLDTRRPSAPPAGPVADDEQPS